MNRDVTLMVDFQSLPPSEYRSRLAQGLQNLERFDALPGVQAQMLEVASFCLLRFPFFLDFSGDFEQVRISLGPLVDIVKEAFSLQTVFVVRLSGVVGEPRPAEEVRVVWQVSDQTAGGLHQVMGVEVDTSFDREAHLWTLQRIQSGLQAIYGTFPERSDVVIDVGDVVVSVSDRQSQGQAGWACDVVLDGTTCVADEDAFWSEDTYRLIVVRGAYGVTLHHGFVPAEVADHAWQGELDVFLLELISDGSGVYSLMELVWILPSAEQAQEVKASIMHDQSAYRANVMDMLRGIHDALFLFFSHSSGETAVLE